MEILQKELGATIKVAVGWVMGGNKHSIPTPDHGVVMVVGGGQWKAKMPYQHQLMEGGGLKTNTPYKHQLRKTARAVQD